MYFILLNYPISVELPMHEIIQPIFNTHRTLWGLHAEPGGEDRFPDMEVSKLEQTGI